MVDLRYKRNDRMLFSYFNPVISVILMLQAVAVSSWSTDRFHRHCPAISPTNSEEPSVASNKAFGKSSRRRQLASRHNFLSSTVLFVSAMEGTDATATTTELVVEAYSGLNDEEFSVLVKAVEEAYSETVGLDSVSCDTTMVSSSGCDIGAGGLLVGCLGRVLSVRTNLDDESADDLRALIAFQMDRLIYESGDLRQPVLVSVQTSSSEETVTSGNDGTSVIIENEIEQYGLRIPVYGNKDDKSPKETTILFTPSLRIAIDGAETQVEDSGETFWDTSSVVVFDDLVNNDLRRRLLEVVKGKKSSSDDWNDVENGPDPHRWIRGGLQDVPDDVNDGDSEEGEVSSCWGLPEEAIEEICFKEHGAIQEFESILTDLFPQFVVSRLPEAVYGECVSPLTANAPVAGEDGLYDYHIDGDPLQTPPSPWTDVYGRYPNRSPGKPRFVSCLVYLSEEWDGSKWGAPTKFYDPPTGDAYEVTPSPGRCVIMDQDLGHTVVPPHDAAGKRPRYSLVWKLILHPKTENQDMDLSPPLSGRNQWPEPVLFGSAATSHP